MSYLAVLNMVNSNSLRDRLIACAAVEGILDPPSWVARNIYKLVTQPEWADDWQYAEDNYTLDKNPDTGSRPDVINDGKMLAGVQAVKSAEEGTP